VLVDEYKKYVTVYMIITTKIWYILSVYLNITMSTNECVKLHNNVTYLLCEHYTEKVVTFNDWVHEYKNVIIFHTPKLCT